MVPVASQVLDRIEMLGQMFIRTRRSPYTRRGYANHLSNWIVWCRENAVDVLDARHAHIQLWLASREEAGDSGSTMATRLSAVSSWYKWLRREEVVTFNTTSLLPEERPKPDPVHTPALSPEQAEKLMAAADADSHRASLLVALMLYTGARIGELLGATLEDVGQESGTPVLRIIGKGRRRRALPLIPAVVIRLDRYLVHRGFTSPVPALPGQVRPSTPLIATKTGKAVMRNDVRRVLLRCAQKAGLPPEVIEQLRPHSTRATYATTNLAAGVPLRDVQYALGHANPRTTEGYDRSRLQLDRHPSTRLAAVIKAPVLD